MNVVDSVMCKFPHFLPQQEQLGMLKDVHAWSCLIAEINVSSFACMEAIFK